MIASTLLYAAIKMIGPFRTAIIDNSAPVWAIVLAALLLGQRLNAVQLFGGALVIGAVLLVQLSLRVPVRPAGPRRKLAAVHSRTAARTPCPGGGPSYPAGPVRGSSPRGLRG